MKYIFTILLLAACMSVQAQQMLIEKGGENNEVISLDNLKRITFNGTTVNVEQNDGTKSSSAMGEIERIYFGDFTAIDDVNTQSRELVTYITREEIAINSPAGTLVTVYDVIGSQVISIRLGSDGEAISIAQLPKGIYIVKANDKTAKILRR